MKQQLKKKFNCDLPVHVSPSEAQRVCVLEATNISEGRDDGIFTLAVDDLIDMQQVVVYGYHLGLLFRAAENALVGR